MEKFLIVLFISITWAASATELPMFSAFTSGKYLLVTINGDSCNTFDAFLDVPMGCHKDRDTLAYVESCEMNLSVVGTVMGCDDTLPVPVSFVIDMNEAGVTKELKHLKLNWVGSIDVKIEPADRD